MHTMALGVLHERHGVVEAHGLVVEKSHDELGRVVALEVGARVGDEGEARRVGLGEAVEREGCDGADDVVGRLPHDPPLGHPSPELSLDVPHALLRALEAHGPAQFLGLAAREAGHGHGHAEELLLEERNTQRPSEDGLERGVRIDRPAPGRCAG